MHIYFVSSVYFCRLGCLVWIQNIHLNLGRNNIKLVSISNISTQINTPSTQTLYLSLSHKSFKTHKTTYLFFLGHWKKALHISLVNVCRRRQRLSSANLKTWWNLKRQQNWNGIPRRVLMHQTTIWLVKIQMTEIISLSFHWKILNLPQNVSTILWYLILNIAFYFKVKWYV